MTDEYSLHIVNIMNRVYKTAEEHGWWDNVNPVNIPEKLCLIHSEVSEALEEYRNGKDHLYYGPDGKPEGIASELADVIIRVLDLSKALQLPIVEALVAKMDYNDKRPYRHGNKKC